MPSAGEIAVRIREWCTKRSEEALPSVEIWSLMNEVADDLTSKIDPWFGFQWGQTTRDATAANNNLTDLFIPRPMNSGSYMIQANFDAGMIPDNSEYLRQLPYPDLLMRPMEVFYGPISENVKLEFKSYSLITGEYPIDTTSGTTPLYFCSLGENLILAPTPPFALTLNVFGLYRAEPIEDANDENTFTVHAEEVLLWGVLDKLVYYGFEEDARAGLFEKHFRTARQQIVARGRGKDYLAQRVVSKRAGAGRFSHG
jgi:hypothetical protein